MTVRIWFLGTFQYKWNLPERSAGASKKIKIMSVSMSKLDPEEGVSFPFRAASTRQDKTDHWTRMLPQCTH